MHRRFKKIHNNLLALGEQISNHDLVRFTLKEFPWTSFYLNGGWLKYFKRYKTNSLRIASLQLTLHKELNWNIKENKGK